VDLFGAIELDDLHGIRAALEAGADVNIVRDGMTPLLAAIDAEGDSHTQTGEPLRVDATALLLARGADPTLVPSGGMSPEQLASD
jgi:hypothetical protein